MEKYELTIDNATNDECDDVEIFVFNSNKIFTNWTSLYLLVKGKEIESYSEEDIIILSKNFPDFTFGLYCNENNELNIWNKFFVDGEMISHKNNNKVTKFDKIYKEIVETIDKKGIWSEGNVRTKYADGTPAHYKSYIGYQFRLDNSTDEAHLITTRFAPSKAPIRELYWIWIMQSNDVDELNKLKCKFWDEWKMNDGTIGKAYGYQIAKQTFGYKSQLDYVIGELKKNPNSRRIMTEIWVPEDLDKMALTPCVHLTQWSVIGNKLYLEVRQRSCDVALGLVANVFQYSILHKLVAMECNLEPAEIIWNIHNVHIYDRHMPELLEQIKRPSIDGATAKIENFKSIYDFKPDDVIVENYQYGDKISYEVAI